MTPDFAEVAPNVFVGNCSACDQKGSNFDRIVHIWRDDVPPIEDHQCWDVKYDRVKSADLAICYADGRSLVTNACPNLDKIVNYLSTISPHERLLIHCMAGITRSNTIALVALLQRGLPLGIALELIYLQQWAHRKIAANICYHPMEDILRYFKY